MSADTPPRSGNGIKGLVLTGVSLVGLTVLTYGLGLVFGIFPMWYQNYAPKQPIPFSHKIHAGQREIPCLYCHGAAEYADYAEVPGLEVCMNCHTQVKKDSPWIKQITEAYNNNTPIPWVKVHVLPDFVQFKHSPHIQAGVECQECHGPVEKMDRVYQYAGLNMGWCIDCHRNDNHVTKRREELSKITKLLKGEGEKSFISKMLSHPDPSNADVNCSVCHY
jgi:hypothetical protein